MLSVNYEKETNSNCIVLYCLLHVVLCIVVTVVCLFLFTEKNLHHYMPQCDYNNYNHCAGSIAVLNKLMNTSPTFANALSKLWESKNNCNCIVFAILHVICTVVTVVPVWFCLQKKIFIIVCLVVSIIITIIVLALLL